MVERAQHLRKKWKGFFPFLLAIALEFSRYRFPCISVTAGDWHYHGPAWEVLLTKIPRYAFLMKISSPLSMDAGQMKICLIPGLPKSRLLMALPFLLFSGLSSLPEAQFLSAPVVSIESFPPLKFHGDGELIGETPATFRVLPKALNVVMPSPSFRPSSKSGHSNISEDWDR